MMDTLGNKGLTGQKLATQAHWGQKLNPVAIVPLPKLNPIPVDSRNMVLQGCGNVIPMVE
jgi:hypothetical protein